jgi:hypothetical protein
MPSIIPKKMVTNVSEKKKALFRIKTSLYE